TRGLYVTTGESIPAWQQEFLKECVRLLEDDFDHRGLKNDSGRPTKIHLEELEYSTASSYLYQLSSLCFSDASKAKLHLSLEIIFQAGHRYQLVDVLEIGFVPAFAVLFWAPEESGIEARWWQGHKELGLAQFTRGMTDFGTSIATYGETAVDYVLRDEFGSS